MECCASSYLYGTLSKSNAAGAGIDAAFMRLGRSKARVPSCPKDRASWSEVWQLPLSSQLSWGWIEQRYLPEGLERGAFSRPSQEGWEAWRYLLK